jgi:hypothetical protein
MIGARTCYNNLQKNLRDLDWDTCSLEDGKFFLLSAQAQNFPENLLHKEEAQQVPEASG